MTRLMSSLALVALIVCFLAIAAVFVVLNGPLIDSLLGKLWLHEVYGSKTYRTILEAAIPSESKTSPNAALLSLALLALGFTLNAFSQILTYAVGSGLSWCYTKREAVNSEGKRANEKPNCNELTLKPHEHFIGGETFLGTDYAPFSAWIRTNRAYSSQWEWEMLNHYLYWGMSFNLFFHVIASSIVNGSFPLLPFVIALLLTWYCVKRGKTLLMFLKWGQCKMHEEREEREVRGKAKVERKGAEAEHKRIKVELKKLKAELKILKANGKPSTGSKGILISDLPQPHE